MTKDDHDNSNIHYLFGSEPRTEPEDVPLNPPKLSPAISESAPLSNAELMNIGYAAVSELHDTLYFGDRSPEAMSDAMRNAKQILIQLLNHIDRESGPNRKLINSIYGIGSTSLSFNIPASAQSRPSFHQVQTSKIGSVF